MFFFLAEQIQAQCLRGSVCVCVHLYICLCMYEYVCARMYESEMLIFQKVLYIYH